ncbi:hypothetical protein [Brucella cytisi]
MAKQTGCKKSIIPFPPPDDHTVRQTEFSFYSVTPFASVEALTFVSIDD